MSNPLIDSLIAAVQASPDDLPLRRHLAELLIGAGRGAEAVTHLAVALQHDPAHGETQALMSRALGAPAPAAPGPPEPDFPQNAPAEGKAPANGLDWRAYEQEFAESVPPRFARSDDEPDPVTGDQDRIVDVESSSVRLADVGGMADVKKRLEMAFLAPMRNDKLRALYGKSLRGGLLLYGPPGCGKTFLARAVAGEMGARFATVSLVDVLNMWIGQSEQNLHEIFQTARRNAPCVLFLDEVDALGHKRSQLQSSAMRTLGNQLLAELDGMEGVNDGVFVLAATNAPWDVDPALRRPGRLDRTVLVVPPDAAARQAILEVHLRDRPIAGIDLKRLAATTERFSGADLAHLCETAAEYAMHDSLTTGHIRMIEQRDFEAALREIQPSTGAWMTTARNVAMFANGDGAYNDLAKYLKKNKLL
ncbi:AAA family ATPase [Jidongwangia harbinensis]|uniref:AAA family ATPase n=1 Tax=Jidongwangia harbinensis TaxID=2878561 RepID=UPI001CD98720|nr:AAA family ATPase [Jidongwangia harbinensis]MCA2217974.1 AAA family ATPase [Jidongwangia harbinensis]